MTKKLEKAAEKAKQEPYFGFTNNGDASLNKFHVYFIGNKEIAILPPPSKAALNHFKTS